MEQALWRAMETTCLVVPVSITSSMTFLSVTSRSLIPSKVCVCVGVFVMEWSAHVHIGLTAETIRLAIRNATGTRAALFIPEQAFEILVKKQIARLREPSLQCIGLVYDELQRIVSQVEGPELLRYGVLRERLVEVCWVSRFVFFFANAE